MQYVIVLEVPDEDIEGDDSIEAVCGEMNDLLSTTDPRIGHVRPLSELLAC